MLALLMLTDVGQALASSFGWFLLQLIFAYVIRFLASRVRECKVVMLSGRTKGCFESPPYLDQVTNEADSLHADVFFSMGQLRVWLWGAYSRNILIINTIQ